MTNEIKVGDKVRVSKDAPKIYTMYGSFGWEVVESTVGNIDGDAAEIKYFWEDYNEFYRTVLPTKYLIKVNDEREEPKFKVGNKVQVKQGLGKFNIATIVYCHSKDHSYRVEFVNEDAVGSLWYAESDLEPYAEPTAPTIKEGDKVRYLPDGICGIICKCANNHYVIEFNDELCCCTALKNVDIV